MGFLDLGRGTLAVLRVTFLAQLIIWVQAACSAAGALSWFAHCDWPAILVLKLRAFDRQINKTAIVGIRFWERLHEIEALQK